MKHAAKVLDALDKRQKNAPAGQGFRKPGSQNRKKGYKRREAQGR